jgi:transcriptional regulator with XRE-family HTH domain
MVREDRGLVSPSEIAEMAGVSRGAVSNWRSGDRTDFPRPAGGSEARPLFDIAEVRAWLVERNYQIPEDRGDRIVWSLLNRFRGELPIETTVDVLINVLVCRRLSQESPALREAWQQVLSAAPSEPSVALSRLGRLASQENPAWTDLVKLPEGNGQDRLLTSLVILVNELEAENLGYIADDALRRVAAAQARSAGEYGLVGSRVSALLASLAASRNPQTVYDPACGIAEALLKTCDARGRDVRLVGHDINVNVVRVARQRCFLAGAEADFIVGLECGAIIRRSTMVTWGSAQGLVGDGLDAACNPPPAFGGPWLCHHGNGTTIPQWC